MRIESSITSISWIPSEAIEGPSKIPFQFGITHYDQPPPDEIGDLEALRREDRFREANELRAFIEVDGEGRVIDHGYLGGGHIGSTTVKLGPAAVRFPAVHLPDIQAQPEVGPTSVRFVQTVGGRMGLPTPRPVPHKPFAQLWPSIAWTTLALTINADGSASHEVVGASPFPRHWFYDHDGKLIEKSATIDFRKWFNESYGDHTPWGNTDSDAVVTAVGSALERQLSTSIMHGGKKPKIRSLKEGDSLVEQGKPGCRGLPGPGRHVRGRGRRREGRRGGAGRRGRRAQRAGARTAHRHALGRDQGARRRDVAGWAGPVGPPGAGRNA